VIGFDANRPASFGKNALRLRARKISCPTIASRRKKITGHPGAITITGIRLIGRQFDIIDIPVGFQFVQLIFVNQFHVRAQLALHFHV
jgi:hypothetical protein